MLSIPSTVYVSLKNVEWSKIFRVIYTRGRVDVIGSPEDEHLVARNN